nr:hypothetical protein CUSKHUHK_CUSKHUHK_CDS_0008 [Microvirus sp.]
MHRRVARAVRAIHRRKAVCGILLDYIPLIDTFFKKSGVNG